MTNTFKNFEQLHHQSEPLLIGNVWNVQSAKVFEKLNFKAIATSSAAVAETLGYKDGQNMPFDEYLFVVKRIKESTATLLSVDLEAGYGNSEDEIVGNIKQLYDLGIAGINLEDSIVQNSNRVMQDADVFGERLFKITEKLGSAKIDIFINVRSDVFLLNLPDARNETIRRISRYATTGIHGIFMPCITDIQDIEAVVGSTTLPLNVMCMPGLPDFKTLRRAGVKRISMGNFLNSAMYRNMENQVAQILAEGVFDSLFTKEANEV